MDNFVDQILRYNGYLLPTSEEEVAAFEEALAAHDIPPIPADLVDPGSILDAPPPDSGRIIKLNANSSTQQQDFVAAARSGTTISPTDLAKMMKDIDDAKNKKQ